MASNPIISMEEILNKITEFLGGNIWFNIATLLIAIFGCILSVYFFRKGKKTKKPTYSIVTNNLVRDSIKDIDSVQITYKGENIPNLSVSKITFWNAGKDTIQKFDITKKCPLKVTIEDGYRILDAKIIFQKNDASLVKAYLNPKKNEVIISFDYLDFEDGFVLQIFHTADSSDEICVTGTIKTVRELEKRYNTDVVTRFIKKFIRNRKIIDAIQLVNDWNIVALGVLLVVTALLPDSILVSTHNNNSSISLRIALGGLGILYTYLGYSRVKRGIPKGYPK